MDVKTRSPHEVTPKTLSVIATAVAAYLGKSVRIRSARMLDAPVDRWARQGRMTVQTSHNLTPRGR